MRKAQIAALSAATVLVAGGYYGLADALDLVPGVVTVAQEDIDANPFPTVAAADVVAPTIEGLSEDAPVPSTDSLNTLASNLANDDLISGSIVGVSVIDVLTGETLLDYQADTVLTPASSNKLLTAWAALSLLGADHTLETSTVLDGDTVTLVGGGDTLLAEDEGDPEAIIGHAGLGDLARATAAELQSQDITTVNVRLDDTLFTGDTWNDVWDEDYSAWVAPVQPLMLDVTAHYGTGGYPEDPAMEAATVFAQALSEAGITVNGEVERAAATEEATELAVVESSPLADILSVSLKHSDNTMTEVEGFLVAAATGEETSFEGAATAVLAQLEADGFDTSGVTMLDSSGLADGDKVPAALLAEIVARAAAGDAGTVGRTLITDLPVAALDGTLDDRFLSTDAAGEVRAKTGSLSQVASLSGVATTAENRQVAFAIVINDFEEGGLWSARYAMDNDFVIPLTQ